MSDDLILPKERRPKGRSVTRGRPRGPSKMTQDRVDIILQCLSEGLSFAAAAKAAGIAPTTLQDWRAQDDVLNHQCEQAIASWERQHVNIISRSGQEGDWRASAWLLSRRFPDRWGERKPEMERQQEIVIRWADEQDNHAEN